MTRLTVTPKHWYSWKFVVMGGPRQMADVGLSSWREKGAPT